MDTGVPVVFFFILRILSTRFSLGWFGIRQGVKSKANGNVKNSLTFKHSNFCSQALEQSNICTLSTVSHSVLFSTTFVFLDFSIFLLLDLSSFELLDLSTSELLDLFAISFVFGFRNFCMIYSELSVLFIALKFKLSNGLMPTQSRL